MTWGSPDGVYSSDPEAKAGAGDISQDKSCLQCLCRAKRKTLFAVPAFLADPASSVGFQILIVIRVGINIPTPCACSGTVIPSPPLTFLPSFGKRISLMCLYSSWLEFLLLQGWEEGLAQQESVLPRQSEGGNFESKFHTLCICPGR